MSKWFEYDKVNGVRETNVSDPHNDNRVIVHKEQNVQGLLDRNQEVRATGGTDSGIKRGFWWYCSIPMVTQYELLTKYGLNIHNKNHTDRIFQVINTDYPKLKLTDKTHFRSHTGSRKRTSMPKPGNSLNDTSPTPTLIVAPR